MQQYLLLIQSSKAYIFESMTDYTLTSPGPVQELIIKVIASLNLLKFLYIIFKFYLINYPNSDLHKIKIIVLT